MALIKKITLPNSSGTNVTHTFNASKLDDGSGAYSQNGALYSENLKVVTASENGKIPSSLLPGYVDDVVEGYLYNSKFYEETTHTTQITGETGKIYVDLSTNKTYRWSGSAFVVISETLAIGTTDSTAAKGSHTHVVTSTFTDSGSTFTGTQGNVSVSGTPNGSTGLTIGTTDTTGVEYTPNGSVNIPGMNVEGTVTGEFVGNEVEIAASFTGSSTTSSGNFTPSGTIEQPTFTGTAATITVGNTQTGSHNHIFTASNSATVPLKDYLTGVNNHDASDIAKTLTGSFSGASLTSTGKFTPSGSVSQPTFTGSAATSGAPAAGANSAAATTSVATAAHTHSVSATGTSGGATQGGTVGETSVTPGGTISNEYEYSSTGTTLYSKIIKQFTGGGGFSASVSDGILTLEHTAATGEDVSIDHSHNYDKLTRVASVFTGTAASHSHGFTGSEHTHSLTVSGSASATADNTDNRVSVASSAHRHSVTATGTVSKPSFSGTQGDVSVTGTPSGSVTIAASTTNASLSHGTTKGANYTYTPSGTIGNSAVSITASTSYTPEGTVSAPKFTGAQGTVSVTGTPKGSVKLAIDGGTPAATVSVTPTGDISITENLTTPQTTATFTGTKVYFKPSFTGSSTTFTGKFTPAGSVAAKGTVASSCGKPV